MTQHGDNSIDGYSAGIGMRNPGTLYPDLSLSTPQQTRIGGGGGGFLRL